jgi:hypothetical protein
MFQAGQRVARTKSAAFANPPKHWFGTTIGKPLWTIDFALQGDAHEKARNR